MKKLISCLLVVVMLFTAACAFAESSGMGRFGKSNALTKFLKETDTQTKDLALQVQSGDQVADLVVRADGDNYHFVTRNNNAIEGHVQLNPTGIYLDTGDSVTLLRYATVSSVMEEIANKVDAMLEEAVKNAPKEKAPSKEQVKKALKKLAVLAAAVEAQEEADAATLSAAALSFADKFKPEYILDVKQDAGSVQISLRSEAYATALAEAMDELMLNPDLVELVDRRAALTGGKTFAAYQKSWIASREATLEAIRSIQSSDTIGENGHWVSHFQIGEDASETKVLVYDTDAWIDAENGNAEIIAALGFKDEDPFLVYELAVDQYSYHEKLSSGDSNTDVQVYFENNQINSGKVTTVIEGQEWMRVEAAPDYLYMKGPKGAISTSVRETWTGKTRYELVVETAEGEEASVYVDFYEDGDSLVCELSSDKADQSAMFKVSRIDKLALDDLSASGNINEITTDQVKAGLKELLKKAYSGAKKGK